MCQLQGLCVRKRCGSRAAALRREGQGHGHQQNIFTASIFVGRGLETPTDSRGSEDPRLRTRTNDKTDSSPLMVRLACLPAGRLTMSEQVPLVLSLSKDEPRRTRVSIDLRRAFGILLVAGSGYSR